jgi:hypothetical protein
VLVVEVRSQQPVKPSVLRALKLKSSRGSGRRTIGSASSHTIAPTTGAAISGIT